MTALSERIVLKDQTCPLIRLDKARRKDKSVGFSVSLGLHMVIFILVGVSLVKPPQYGVEQGLASIEVDLVSVESQALEVAPEKTNMEETLDPELKLAKEQVAVERPKPMVLFSLKSSAGAQMEIKPQYLKNPAPVYPQAARKQKQEGTVIVYARISKNGLPFTVSIEKSSGYVLLDQAALKAVKQWRFRPAKLGTLPIEASVRVPIRFDLLPQDG